MNRREFCPDEIFRLGQRNTLVYAVLTEWRMGSLRWDEALAYMVVLLADQNEKLLDNARLFPDPIILKEERKR